MSEKKPEERIGINEEAIETLKKSDDDQWDAINKLRNRPPVYVTFVFAILTFALGWMASMLKNGG